jgi:hypothetical protein
MTNILLFFAASILFLAVGCSSIERSLVFYPTHDPEDNGLTPWPHDGKTIGYARIVAAPKNIWLMLHGNGGQAAMRSYALPCFSEADSVFILEYPGYGNRKGTPSKKAFDQAASEAYQLLRSTYTNIPVCVVGESIGSGPASALASQTPPPDKLVLAVPYDRFSLVAKDHFPSWLVWLLLSTDWDNAAALAHYKGPVEIFGATDDTVIPVGHAQALATAVPTAKFTLIEGGHNDWSRQNKVRIRNP